MLTRTMKNDDDDLRINGRDQNPKIELSFGISDINEIQTKPQVHVNCLFER